LPKSRELDQWIRQLIRSSSSFGANYRAALRARSTADFVNKLKIVEEEADESIYWLELIGEAELSGSKETIHLLDEANELLAIIVASIKTARKKKTNEV
jgi:four helix bundle protein